MELEYNNYFIDFYKLLWSENNALEGWNAWASWVAQPKIAECVILHEKHLILSTYHGGTNFAYR